MKPLTYILLFLSLGLNAQEGMVLIGGDVSHQIDVPDELTQDVLERWKVEMKIAGIDFQEPLRKIDKIEYIERDYHYFGEIKDRTIYLNKALEEYPFCKRAAIIQMLFINQGGKVDKEERISATSNFKSKPKSERLFKLQYEGMAMFNEIKRELK